VAVPRRSALDWTLEAASLGILPAIFGVAGVHCRRFYYAGLLPVQTAALSQIRISPLQIKWNSSLSVSFPNAASFLCAN
jgi:hypothetical protein